MPGERGLLAVADLPAADPALDDEAEAVLERMIEAVRALRRYRDEVGAKPGATCAGCSRRGLRRLREQLGRLARFEWVDGLGGRDALATGPIPGGGVKVLPSEAFDSAEAEARLEKRAADLRNEIERAEKKLSNEQFVAKAPAAVVEEERRKLEEYREALERLRP